MTDTGEFLNPDVGYQRAVIHDKKQRARIAELEDLATRLARRLHRRAHHALKPFSECDIAVCQEARMVLGKG